MGMLFEEVNAIVREHRYNPIKGDVLLIGRQTVYVTPQEFVEICRDNDVKIAESGILTDSVTLGRLSGYEGRELIRDTEIFRLLGAKTVQAMDVSSYETAELIHNLNYPIPDKYRGIADFIFDGSTLDNVFNGPQALMNFGSLLKPYGRIIGLNAFSGHNTPYSMLHPNAALDYFVFNGFSDAKVYVGVSDDAKFNAYWLDVDFLQDRRREMGRFVSPYRMTTHFFAEKSAKSTSDMIPTQQDYRSDREWVEFCEKLSAIQKSRRPHLYRSNCKSFVDHVLGGHLLIDSRYEPVL